MEATAAQPEPEPETGPLVRMTFEALRDMKDALERSPDDHVALTEASQRLGSIEAAMLRLAEMRARFLSREPEAPLTAVPSPRPARHRQQRPRNPLLNVVKGIAPAGGLAAAVRHSWPAAHPIPATLATAAAGLAVAGTAVVAPHTAATFGFGHTAGTPGPAASVVAATPLPLVPPSEIAAAFTRPKGKAGTTLSMPVPPSAPAYVPATDPPGGTVPAPEPSSALAAPEGTLEAVTTQLALGADGTTYTGMITVVAQGGPVTWRAVRRSRDITLDANWGTLEDGQAATITVTVTAAAQVADGSSAVLLWPGDVRIPVTWVGLPPPPPVPSPTDLPAQPAADPSPSPS